MTMRVFNIGIGLFILIILWTTGVLVFIISRKINSSTSFIGSLYIFLISVVTIILCLIPRYKLNFEHQSSNMDKMFENFKLNPLNSDWMYFWRSSLIIFNLFAILIVSIIIYTNYLSKKNIRSVSKKNLEKVENKEQYILQENLKKVNDVEKI